MSKDARSVTRRFTAGAWSILAGMILLADAQVAWAQKQAPEKDEPLHLEVRCEIAPGSYSALCNNSQDVSYYTYTIPAGKRYVIEYIEIGGRAQSTQPVRASIGTNPRNSNWGGVRWFDIWASVIASSSTWHPVHGYRTGRWYAEGERSVWFAVSRSHTVGSAELVIKLYGYLTPE